MACLKSSRVQHSLPVLKSHDLEHAHECVQEIIKVGDVRDGAEQLNAEQSVDEHEENEQHRQIHEGADRAPYDRNDLLH